jgi:hypothetical protein
MDTIRYVGLDVPKETIAPRDRGGWDEYSCGGAGTALRRNNCVE